MNKISHVLVYLKVNCRVTEGVDVTVGTHLPASFFATDCVESSLQRLLCRDSHSNLRANQSKYRPTQQRLHT